MNFAYPVVLDVSGVPVLVVGAGPVAARKVAGLAAAGARVRVVAPDVSPALDQAAVADLRRRPYRPEDLDGVRLVVTATGDPDVDAAVAADARPPGCGSTPPTSRPTARSSSRRSPGAAR